MYANLKNFIKLVLRIKEVVLLILIISSLILWLFTKSGSSGYNWAAQTIISLILGLTLYYALLNLVNLYRSYLRKDPETYITYQYTGNDWLWVDDSNIKDKQIITINQSVVPPEFSLFAEEQKHAYLAIKGMTEKKNAGSMRLIIFFKDRVIRPKITIDAPSTPSNKFKKGLENIASSGAFIELKNAEIGTYTIYFNRQKDS